MEPTPAPKPIFYYYYYYSFETFPTHPPTTPPLSPINLFTYKLKMCYSHPHPPSHPPSIFLPTNPLNRYLANPTYMAKPTYLGGTLINPPTVENNQERIK